jgi:hypothetical protein
VDTLSASALAHHAKYFALVNRIGDAINRMNHAISNVEARLQVFDPQQFIHSFSL